MTRRWTPMETSLISRKIAVCSTVFNLFIQLNVIQVTNKSSDFCACIRKNYGETLMFRSMFSMHNPHQSTSFPRSRPRNLTTKLREWLEWPIWIRQKMGNDFQNLILKTQETTKTWKWQQHKKKNAPKLVIFDHIWWFLFDTCPSTWRSCFQQRSNDWKVEALHTWLETGTNSTNVKRYVIFPNLKSLR